MKNERIAKIIELTGIDATKNFNASLTYFDYLSDKSEEYLRKLEIMIRLL